MVASWRRAGLSILGKTNTPEFAGEFVTEPATYGPALNPWNAAHTVGGSSGGAGAAVASGMVPIAHGTDLGGSIRIPAACCGVFGFKPSVGLNPLGPFVEEIAGGLDSDHVLTRTVRDSAASLDITSVGAGGAKSPGRATAEGFASAWRRQPGRSSRVRTSARRLTGPRRGSPSSATNCRNTAIRPRREPDPGSTRSG
jgi:amidase